MSYALTDTAIAQYKTEGYIVLPSVFDGDDLRRVDETIRAMTRAALQLGVDYRNVLEIEPEPVDGERVCRRIYNPFEQHETFRSIATDERMLDRIASLIGPDFGLQHSKLNMKPARVGSVVDWHQDLAYFPHTNDDLVTALIYLDEATEQNGCLQVLPRHHTHYFNHIASDGMFAGLITENLDDGRFGKPIALAAPAGSVIFMHCLTPHSSLPNRSDKPRRTMIFEYRAADAFPIFYSEKTMHDEAVAHHLRGCPAHHARFGGPSPYIPRFPHSVTSLYELQLKTKAAAKCTTRTSVAQDAG